MPIPLNPQPISRFSIREEVYNTLLEWIMEGVLRPGEKILDKDLAERMGISRTPVREALRRLEDKKLVESAANRWTRISEISIAEPELIYPIIWSLEQLAVEQALPRLQQADLRAMEQANAELEQALRVNDSVAASKADSRFHAIYIKASDNPFLLTIINDLKVRCRRIEVVYFGGSALAYDSVVEHRLISAALAEGDLESLRRTIRLNWQSSLNRIKAVLAQRTNN